MSAWVLPSASAQVSAWVLLSTSEPASAWVLPSRRSQRWRGLCRRRWRKCRRWRRSQRRCWDGRRRRFGRGNLGRWRHRFRLRRRSGLLGHRNGDWSLSYVDHGDGYLNPVAAPFSIRDQHVYGVGCLGLEVQLGAGQEVAGVGVDTERPRVQSTQIVSQLVVVSVRCRDRGADWGRRRRIFGHGALRTGTLDKVRRAVRRRGVINPSTTAGTPSPVTTTTSAAASVIGRLGRRSGVVDGLRRSGVVDGQRSR